MIRIASATDFFNSLLGWSRVFRLFPHWGNVASKSRIERFIVRVPSCDDENCSHQRGTDQQYEPRRRLNKDCRRDANNPAEAQD